MKTNRHASIHYGVRAVVCALLFAVMALGNVSVAADRYWVAGGAGNWSDPSNWSTSSSGAPGASVPGSGDKAIFDTAGTGDCALDNTVDVQGLRITNDYAGTITQGDHAISIAAGGYIQSSGTFAGGTADIVITGTDATAFTLTGGSFTSTSGILSLACGAYFVKIMIFTGGSFHHNNGTLRFASSYYSSWSRTSSIIVSNSLTLHDLDFIGGDSYPTKDVDRGYLVYNLTLATNETIVVTGDLTMRRDDANTNRTFALSGGEIQLYGNLIVGPGAGGGGTKLIVKGDGDRTYSSFATGRRNYTAADIAGDSFLPCLRVDMSGGTFKPTDTTTNLSARVFELVSGNFTAPPEVFTIFATDESTLFSFTGGTYQHNNSVLRLAARLNINWSRSITVSLGQPLTLMHLDYSGGNEHADGTLYHRLTQTTNTAVLSVLGDFRMERWGDHTNRTFRAVGGEIELYGNLIVGPGADGGYTKLIVKGDGDQTYASAATGERIYDRVHTGNSYLPCLRVEKTGGTFTPSAATTNLTATEFQLASGTFTAPTGVFAIVKDSRALPGENNSMYGYNYFTITNGSYLHNNSTLRLANFITDSTGREYFLNLSRPLTLNHLDYAGGNDHSSAIVAHSLVVSASEGVELSVLGDLTMERWGDNTNRTFRAKGGTIRVHGDVTIGAGAAGDGGITPTSLLLAGDREQMILHRGGIPPQGLWTIAKTGGRATLASDLSLSGATQDIHWASGALNLSSNTLSVGRNVNIAPDATTFGVAVADAATAGRLTSSGALTGIEHLGLNVAIEATAAELAGRTYVILDNSAPLGSKFANVMWPSTWKGKVDYTGDGGREVMLYEIEKISGTRFKFR